MRVNFKRVNFKNLMRFKKIRFKSPVEKTVIMGCAARGDGNSPYLTRWTLHLRRGDLKLHHFHRSDAGDAFHSHPWNFWSLVLWPGYDEVTPEGRVRHRPLSLAYRPAETLHRVQLLMGTCPLCGGSGINRFTYDDECVWCGGFCTVERPCWTLVWTGPKFRRWGFHTADGYKDFQDYFREKGC